jgi:glycosyltransferase involved in cell wall biosynthesis
MKYKLIKIIIIKDKIFKSILVIFLLINLSKYEKKEYYLNKKEIKLIKEYYKINNKILIINRKNFNKSEFPKVSIISSVFNREKYIPIFIRSILNQKLLDIELILIDDSSEDDSIKVIEKFKRVDPRIILIKNKKNKGTFISRNIGALKAKGEFLIFPDSDDIISKDILDICYEICKKYNYDLIRFNMHSENFFIFSLIDAHLKKEIFQPELRTYLIYGYGIPKLIDGIISNKFISKRVYLISLNNIEEYFLNQKMIYFEDGLMNFALHLNAKSLYLLNHIGYFYINNKESVSHFVNLDSYLRCFFIYLKFFIENTKNNKLEQEMNFFIFNEYIYDFNLLNHITNYSKIYEEVINSLMNNRFISHKDLEKTKNFKKKILNISYHCNKNHLNKDINEKF